MAYETKQNKGSAWPLDDRVGDVILAGKINVDTFQADPKRDHMPKVLVVNERVNQGQKNRLALYVQVGTLFAEPEDSDKSYAYSGPFGNNTCFGYRNTTSGGQSYLGLSVVEPNPDYANGSMTATVKENNGSMPATETTKTPEDLSDDIPF